MTDHNALSAEELGRAYDAEFESACKTANLDQPIREKSDTLPPVEIESDGEVQTYASRRVPTSEIGDVTEVFQQMRKGRGDFTDQFREALGFFLVDADRFVAEQPPEVVRRVLFRLVARLHLIHAPQNETEPVAS